VQGQGCASPVPPFAGEVERFPDEPGARPLTCQLSAQIIGPPRAGATRCPGAGWGTSEARQTVEPEVSRQEGREAVGLPHTSCPVCRLNRPFPACIRFAAVRCWLVTPAMLERTANGVCVSAPLLRFGGGAASLQKLEGALRRFCETARRLTSRKGEVRTYDLLRKSRAPTHGREKQGRTYTSLRNVCASPFGRGQEAG
jgi:hypothetical protein